MVSTPRNTASAADRKPRTIYQLDSPFTNISWPEILDKHQDTILNLLCSILAPIGQHRRNHVTTSRGKRSQKRKRAEEKQNIGNLETPKAPLQPEISRFVVIGLNSITRDLESLSQKFKSQTEHSKEDASSKADSTPHVDIATHAAAATLSPSATTPICKHFSTIFVPRSSQPSILHAHLPQLVATASRAHPCLPATRLVQLPKDCDARLCRALGIPRVSFIGLLDGAPHADVLVEIIRSQVPEVDIPWLQEVQNVKYMPVKINAVETFMSVSAKEQKVG
ncbi:hypothetical protein QTJ16_005844 [Diplocarpon rosae]|uniref:Rna-processing protein n=1 Tax=Diplocarpon rosae TaxID=946125 RepID=A0AAD9SVU0_9HELO